MANDPAAAATFSTTVDRAGLLRIIQLNGKSRFSGSLTLRSEAGEGLVFFSDGRIVHAESGGVSGEDALVRILRWPGAACFLRASVAAPRVTIDRDLSPLLAQAAVPPPRAAATPAAQRAPARPGPQKPLLLVGIAGAVVLAAIAIVAVTTARRPAGAGGAAGAPGPAAEILLRVGGAKAIAEELAPALAAGYLASLGLEGVRVTSEDTYRSTARGTKDGVERAIAVRGMNTPQGFDELASGALDIAMTGRRIKPEWEQKAAALGKLSSPGAEHVVGISGIAVIVNMANSVPRLDAAQLAAIFGGKVTDWAEVGRPGEGGAPRAVHVYATSEDMGLTDLFKTLALGKLPYAAGARRVASLQEMNDAVAADPDGIGFLTLPFIRGTRAVPLAEADDPPLVPTAFTVATEDYLLTHRLYFYAPPGGANAHVHKFVQFVLGPEGQAIVKRSGYVELSVAAERREARAAAPPEYLRLTSGHRRLTSTFRFEPSAAEFDARALVDLERVTRYLVDARVDGAAVRILGFADAQGDPARNRALSLARADLVAKAFAQRGITGASVHGFGAEMPVASNATEEGRRRNRRVEVWVAE
jgi:phosphate transport system substrate-binding protein